MTTRLTLMIAILTTSLAMANDNAAKAIDSGAAFLLSKQADDGSWGQHPAITGLCLMGIANTGAATEAEREAAITKGLKYMLGFAQQDGSIYPADRSQKSSANYPNYTTSVCLLTFAVLERPELRDEMRAARKYLQNSQFNDPSTIDYGGIGYGKTGRADLSNGAWAAEALYYTDHLDREPFTNDPAAAKRTAKMWADFQTFLTKCQNLPETNKEAYVSPHPDDRGGFFYRPNESKAGDRKAEVPGYSDLVSSGSMTYAGLKSMLYADMDKNDQRVRAAMDYLMRNWTLDENPGMGPQGLYYYLLSMTRALDAYGDEVITAADGSKHTWKQEVANKILAMQQEDGSWANSHGRYMESMPELATSYALITLKHAVGRPDLKRK